MLKTNTNRKSEGFTIIEVLIVLAIAGLIMLLVFLAVPALQRNSRNTARKQDISRIGGAVTDFTSNNNGTLPVTANNAAILNSAGTLSQYTATSPLPIQTGTQSPLTNAQLNNYRIVTGAKCDTAVAGGTTASGATTRQVAVQYMVETSGSPTPVCQDL